MRLGPTHDPNGPENVTSLLEAGWIRGASPAHGKSSVAYGRGLPALQVEAIRVTIEALGNTDSVHLLDRRWGCLA
jgi:hypothetical protein